MKLTVSTINAKKPKDKPYKLSDGKGLFLLINPNGSKYWRLSYRINGKQKTLSMGVFPVVSLADARKNVMEARKLIAQGVDPSDIRKATTAKENGTNTFGTIARQWIATRTTEWTPRHIKGVTTSLEKNIFPHIGHMAINEITPMQLLDVLKRIESRGSLEMLKKIRQRCNAIFVYAKFKGMIATNPAEGISQVLRKHKPQNHQNIKLKELPELVTAINSHPLEPTTKAGLLIALYTFQRTNEIRFARWDEIDFDNSLWTIPAERMKMKREHVVPLSKQAVQVFQNLKPLTGCYELVFASTHKPETQPMSENAMLYALYRMGFHGRMTVHGFRHLASTSLNEMGFDGRWIEKQLSHEDSNAVRGTYNKAEYLPERINMMQEWADFVDRADGSNIVPIGHKKAKDNGTTSCLQAE